MVEIPADCAVTELTVKFLLNFEISLSDVSLVTLPFKSLVTTCPRGNDGAYVFVDGGESSTLSLSCCG